MKGRGLGNEAPVKEIVLLGTVGRALYKQPVLGEMQLAQRFEQGLERAKG